MAMFALIFSVSCGDDGGNTSTETNCTDGQDNDQDGLADCADPDCAGHTNCQTVCNFNSLCEPASGENATNCTDCATNPCNNNGTCELGENETNCPADCSTNPCNNDGTCDAGETTANCPADCPATGTCDSPEALIDQVGCGLGEMCTIVDQNGNIGCGAEGVVADYGECNGTIGDCTAGAFCGANGTTGMCMPYCDLTARVCPGSGVCAYAFTTTAGQVGLCAAPDGCDLVDATGCDTGEGCYIAGGNGETLCITAGTIAVGAACVFSNDCGIGVGCLGDVCVELCKVAGDCTTGTCLNIGQVATGHADVGSCG